MIIFFKSAEIYFLGICCDLYRRSFDRRIERLIRSGAAIADRRTCSMSDRCMRLCERFENAAREIELAIQEKPI